jgi:DNA-binding transcriptional ArsR family regulator
MSKKAPTEYEILKAVGHPVRHEILAILVAGEASAKELAARLKMPLSNVSYHVKVLRELGLLVLVRETPRRGAVERHYRADKKSPAAAWEGLARNSVKPSPAGANIDGRTLTLDKKGRAAVATATKAFVKEIDKISTDASKRSTNGSGQRVSVAVVQSPPA